LNLLLDLVLLRRVEAALARLHGAADQLDARVALLHVNLKITGFFILAQVLALSLDLNRSVLNELLRCYALILINAKAQIRRVTLTSLLGLSRRELMVSWLIILNNVLFAVAAGREALHIHALL